MYGSFESSQYFEVEDRESIEIEFQITLICTALGQPARLGGPPEDCYPAEAPEFEVSTIYVINDDGNPVEVSEEAFRAFVGAGIADKLMEDAAVEANESGEF